MYDLVISVHPFSLIFISHPRLLIQTVSSPLTSRASRNSVALHCRSPLIFSCSWPSTRSISHPLATLMRTSDLLVDVIHLQHLSPRLAICNGQLFERMLVPFICNRVLRTVATGKIAVNWGISHAQLGIICHLHPRSDFPQDKKFTKKVTPCKLRCFNTTTGN